MARVSISEAARLTGKSRTTLHRLIKAGDLSTCSGERNAKMVDTSELLRVFGPFEQPNGEHLSGQVYEGGSLDIENYCTVSLFFEQTYL